MPHSSASQSPVEPVIPVDVAAVPDSAIVRQRPGFAIAAFVVLVAIFVAAFQFPPILDYPNHYARMWLLAGGIAEPPFNRIYALDWNRTFTNVGIDLAAYWLGPVIGVACYSWRSYCRRSAPSPCIAACSVAPITGRSPSSISPGARR
jgi:hypothetical protein